MTGIVARVETRRLRLNEVRSTKKAIIKPIIVDAVAVATPSFNDPQRATMYVGDKPIFHVSRENFPFEMKERRTASKRG